MYIGLFRLLSVNRTYNSTRPITIKSSLKNMIRCSSTFIIGMMYFIYYTKHIHAGTLISLPARKKKYICRD